MQNVEIEKCLTLPAIGVGHEFELFFTLIVTTKEMTSVIDAVKSGDFRKVSEFLALDPKLAKCSVDGNTLLHLAGKTCKKQLFAFPFLTAKSDI